MIFIEHNMNYYFFLGLSTGLILFHTLSSPLLSLLEKRSFLIMIPIVFFLSKILYATLENNLEALQQISGSTYLAIPLCYLVAYYFKLWPRHFLTQLLPTLLMASGIGKIGCWMEGCCLGYHHGLMPHLPLAEAIFFFIYAFYLKMKETSLSLKSSILYDYPGFYFMMRFFIQFLRLDRSIPGTKDLGGLNLDPYQWTCIIGVVSILYMRRKQTKLPPNSQT